MNSIEVKLNGYHAVEPRTLYEQLAGYNSAFPDSQVPANDWLNQANEFRWTVGPTPGCGKVLLLRRDLDLIDIAAPATLLFSDGVSQVTLPNLVIVYAIKVSAGPDNDPNAVYCVDLRDRRHDAQDSTIEDQFNWILPEGYYCSSTKTWFELVLSLWNACGALGGFPGLPYQPHGTPENFRYPGENAYEALNCVLDRLDCALNYDATTGSFSIIQLGDPAGQAAFDAIRAAHDPEMLSTEPIDNPAAKLAGKVRVYFDSRDWTYGQNLCEVTTQDQWNTYPTRWLERGIDGGDADTTATLWDDMSVRFDPVGQIINQADIDARADERAANYRQRYTTLDWHRRTYSGICAGNWMTSSYVTGVRYHEHGDGLKTTILKVPWLPSSDEQSWSVEPCGTACESVASPDIARATTPYNRFVWGTLNEDLNPFGFASATVLWKPDETSDLERHHLVTPGACDWTVQCHAILTGNASVGQESDWKPTNIATLPRVHDFLGIGGKQGDRFIAIWHWQSLTWTVIAYGSSSAEFWAALMWRNGELYGFVEVDVDTSVFGQTATVKLDGRCGTARHINGASHNSQGGTYPEIVRMYGREGNYVFEYSVAPKETSGERYGYKLGDTWDVDNAPSCTKGVKLELIGIGSP